MVVWLCQYFSIILDIKSLFHKMRISSRTIYFVLYFPLYSYSSNLCETCNVIVFALVSARTAGTFCFYNNNCPRNTNP